VTDASPPPAKKRKLKGFDPILGVMLRNEFAKHGFNRVLAALGALSAAVLVQSAVVVGLALSHPDPKYILVNEQGGLIEVVPVDEPGIYERNVVRFAADVAERISTYDWLRHQEQFDRALADFTLSGKAKMAAALKDSKNLAAVVANSMFATGRVVSTPAILNEGVDEGRYYWDLEFTMQVTYQTASDKRTEYHTVRMLVFRRSLLESPSGLGVESFVSRRDVGGVL